jgi:lysophospholipase L1-like esterase
MRAGPGNLVSTARLVGAGAWLIGLGALGEPHASGFKFDFAGTNTPPGYIRVSPTTKFTRETGYGFDVDSEVTEVAGADADPLRDGCCTSSRPFFFSAVVPEGNYKLTVILGDAAGASTTTVKAESRRLMLENVGTAAGQFTSRSFTVNVRRPDLPSGGKVRLKPRELGPPPVLHWDDKLTLEFSGARPRLCALEIERTETALTVYLAGDSTVTDQPNEPWNSWGQMLPRFFKPAVAVANHAESGESLPSFLGSHRLDKILAEMKTGDYLFVQFGHNDQKDKRAGAGAFSTFTTNLVFYINETRRRGGIPVLVTPPERKASIFGETLGDFPAAIRKVAKQEHVALIDLHAMSRVFYRALGDQLGQAFQDGTHHNNYGSYELAKCVVEGIKSNQLALARFLVDEVAAFNPAHPDAVDTFAVPPSPAPHKAR